MVTLAMMIILEALRVMDTRFMLMRALPVQILLVEDDEIDQMAVRRAFRRSQIDNDIVIAGDGLEALEILRGEHEEKTIDGPFIILLDLNMPRMGGLEFLEEVRKDDQLGRCVVFVLTTSDDEGDIAAAYGANVAGYIVKSRVGESFKDLVGVLDPFWKLVQLPAV